MPSLPPHLEDLVGAAIARRGSVSTSRRRQLRWVAGELERYAATLTTGQPRHRIDWVAAEFISGYLAAADAGALRQRGPTDRPCPDATRRARRDCVRMLAAGAHQPDPVDDEVSLPAVKARAEPSQVKIALSHWRWEADRSTARPGEIRAAAMAALTHEVGLRTGELAVLEPDHFNWHAGTLTYQPRPPGVPVPPDPVTVSLSPRTQSLVLRWLEVRTRLVVNTPRTKTLWVSLAANHDGNGLRRPSGLPLHPIGLRRAHARAVAAANFVLAGEPGYSPLPRTPGMLRPDQAR